MRRRWLAVAVLFLGACGGTTKATAVPEPAKPTAAPGPIGLGRRIESDLRQQNDAAKARRALLDEAVESNK